jgi:hypothetical protein
MVIVKGKGCSRIDHEGPEGEQRDSSTLPSTSALDGVGIQSHAPAALPPEKTLYHCTGGWVAPGPIWTGAENLAPTEIRFPDRPARVSDYAY